MLGSSPTYQVPVVLNRQNEVIGILGYKEVLERERVRERDTLILTKSKGVLFLLLFQKLFFFYIVFCLSFLLVFSFLLCGYHFFFSISFLIFHWELRIMEGDEEEAASSNQIIQKRRRFKRICVYCGSRPGYKSTFSDSALELGTQMVERKIDLVYGGGSGGLMGLVSQTVFNGGCHVLGVIPKALLPQEISGETIGVLKIVADMHERKSEMAKNADAFIALPGGYGTMEELLEIIAWSQLGIHEKPVGLLNVDGYYNSLLELFDKGVEEGFIEATARHIVVSADTPQELINKMEEYAPIHDKVATRQSWEIDQLLDKSPTTGHPPSKSY